MMLISSTWMDKVGCSGICVGQLIRNGLGDLLCWVPFGTTPTWVASSSLITKHEIPSPSSACSSPSVLTRDNASGSWCLTPAGWMTSNSNSESRNRQLANLLEDSVRFSIQRNSEWSVSSVNLCPSRYGLKRSISHTTARHSRSVVF